MSSISSLFGIVLNYIYNIVNNYGLAIILFSILLKLILLPISIKQQKTMKKTAKIQGKIKEIQAKYKNDQNKMNQEMMEVYRKEHMSPLSGCLSSIIQIVLLLAMFGLVRNPLTYMLKIDNYTIEKTYQYIGEQENTSISQRYPQISVLKYVSKEENRNKNIEIDKENGEEGEKEELKLSDLYINMNFLGLDLSNIPQEEWQDPTVYIIPALYVITSMVSMKLTTKMTATNKNKQDEVIEIKPEVKEKDKNKEKEKEMDSQDMAAEMSKSMSWFMPIMSVSISIIAPLGLALYWLVNNILMIAERLILNKVIKDEEEQQNG